MIDGTTVLVVLVVLIVSLAAVEFLVVGIAITKGLWGWLRNKSTSTIEIDTPPAIAVAAANRLVAAGSQVVVGYDAEWDGPHVVAYAISPQLVSNQVGTRFEIIHVGPKKLRLRPIPSGVPHEQKQGEPQR